MSEGVRIASRCALDEWVLVENYIVRGREGEDGVVCSTRGILVELAGGAWQLRGSRVNDDGDQVDSDVGVLQPGSSSY